MISYPRKKGLVALYWIDPVPLKPVKIRMNDYCDIFYYKQLDTYNYYHSAES